MSQVTTVPTPRDVPPRQRPVSAVIAVLSVAVFMASLDLFIIDLAFPYIGRDYRGALLHHGVPAVLAFDVEERLDAVGEQGVVPPHRDGQGLAGGDAAKGAPGKGGLC